MDTDSNQVYSQVLNLSGNKFQFKLSYAARTKVALTSSGLIIIWNNAVLLNLPASSDYNIHTVTYTVQSVKGNNLLAL